MKVKDLKPGMVVKYSRSKTSWSQDAVVVAPRVEKIPMHSTRVVDGKRVPHIYHKTAPGTTVCVAVLGNGQWYPRFVQAWQLKDKAEYEAANAKAAAEAAEQAALRKLAMQKIERAKAQLDAQLERLHAPTTNSMYGVGRITLELSSGQAEALALVLAKIEA